MTPDTRRPHAAARPRRPGLGSYAWRGGLALLAALTPLSVARGAGAPEAVRILERFVAATGGRAAYDADRSGAGVGNISAFGMTGRFEFWTQRPDKSASLTQIGPFMLREGFDGVTAWRVDQNGQFSKRDGKELDDARASAYFENEMFLAADQGGGTVRVLRAETDSAGTYDVLEVAPPAGRPREVWFDRATGLIARTVNKADQQTIITRLSRYERMAGRLRARVSMIAIAGMPLNDGTVTLDSAWANPTIDPARFLPPEARTSDVRWRGASPLVLPMSYSVKHVWVKVSVNGGPPEDFLVDTGASISVLDSAFVARTGLATQGRVGVQGAGAGGGGSFAEVDSFVVSGVDGAVTLLGQKAAVLSVDPFLSPYFWRPCSGVLGYDFISRFVMEVDFDAQRMVLHDPKGFRYAGKGTAVPMGMAGNIPVVRARIDDTYEGDFRLDLGSGNTVDLHTPFVRLNQLKDKVGRLLAVTGGGFGGTFTSHLCRMKSMEIGPYRWSDPLVSLSEAETGGLASEDYAGNIGNLILQRFKCTFDYERRVMYLEPSARIAERDRFSRAGAQLIRDGGRVVVLDALPDSPAATAGLRRGDEVLSIDGKAALGWDIDRLNAMFEDGPVGEKHTLQVRRDGKKKKVIIKLAEIL